MFFLFDCGYMGMNEGYDLWYVCRNKGDYVNVCKW